MQRSTHVFPRYLNQNAVHIPTPCASDHHDLVVPLPLSEQRIGVMWLPHTQLSAICRRFFRAMAGADAGFWWQGCQCGICDGKRGVDRFSLSLSHAGTNTRSHSLYLFISFSLIFNTYYFINNWLRLILYTQLTQNALLFPLENGYTNEPGYCLIIILSVLFTINKGIMI
jgi:hypothetical protein